MNPSLSSLFNPRDLQGARARTRSLIAAGSLIIMVMGLGWALYFALRGNLVIFGLEWIMAAIGLVIFRLQRKGHERYAAGLLFSTVFVVILVFSLFLDLPSVAAPRTSHLYFLAMAMCAYYVLHEDPSWLRLGVPLIFAGAFYFFACTHWGIHTQYAMTDSVRVMGTWVNAAGAMLVLGLTLYLMNTDPTMRSELHAAMRDGLASRHFVLFYQPQVDAQGLVVGAEALLRWKDPVRGMVSPAEFIPHAERTGFILPLGAWVLHEACARLALWKNQPEFARLKLSVNVSAYQLRQPDFVEAVQTALEHSGAPPDKLKLELTESMLVKDIEDLITKMDALAQIGVGFSLDDFGTGYSSLAYLKRLPLNTLKIDRSFIQDIPTSSQDMEIVQAIILMAHTLHLQVVTEGVETTQQFEFLNQFGCDFIQGYLLSRPVPFEALQEILEQLDKRPVPAADHTTFVLTRQ